MIFGSLLQHHAMFALGRLEVQITPYARLGFKPKTTSAPTLRGESDVHLSQVTWDRSMISGHCNTLPWVIRAKMNVLREKQTENIPETVSLSV